jgi:hypothetical protein
MSGCDKSLGHGSSVNSVAKDTGSEAPHSLPLNASNAPASVPSNIPAPPSPNAPQSTTTHETKKRLSDGIIVSACFYLSSYITAVTLLIKWTVFYDKKIKKIKGEKI